MFNLITWHMNSTVLFPGTIYLQQTIPLLIISGTSVFSMASGLFIFPAMYLYYKRALEVCVSILPYFLIYISWLHSLSVFNRAEK